MIAKRMAKRTGREQFPGVLNITQYFRAIGKADCLLANARLWIWGVFFGEHNND
jgi:hypothetical protein